MPVVLTVDQRASRSGADAVPELLALLAATPGISEGTLRPFQRTVGDEVQAVLDDPEAVITVIGTILRAGGWSIGVGVGPVDEPLPADARAGRGPAYLCAREAVTRAKTTPHRLSVVGPDDYRAEPVTRAKTTPHRLSVVGPDDYRAEQLETVLWLWAGLLERRTPGGWEVHDALGEGLSHAEAGRRLGVSQSAVTQRAQTAGLVDEARARRLALELLSAMLSGKEDHR